MKAKSPELNSQTPGGYECIWCDCTFTRKAEDSTLSCPACGNDNAKDLVPIYVDEDPEESEMYSDKDFPAGD